MPPRSPVAVGPAIRITRPASAMLSGISTWSGAIGAVPTGPRTKLLHLVRHAQGFHNIDPEVMKQPEGLDAQLTEEGQAQCAALARAVGEGFRPELIVTSPLTRTCQTAALSFGAQLRAGVPLVALEHVRETVNFLCDKRRPLGEIRADMARAGITVDMSAGCAHEHDALWAAYEERFGSQGAFMAHRESADLPALAERARAAFAWLASRPERDIVVVSHSAFYWNLFNMARLGRKAGVAPLVDFCGDRELEAWLGSKFENGEMKTILCEFLE